MSSTDPARADDDNDEETSVSSSENQPWAEDRSRPAYEPPRDERAHAGPGAGGPRPVSVEPTDPDVPTGPAVGTLVWGCVVLAVAALLGAWELAGLRLDLSLVVPVGMVVLGLLLVVGAVATAVRSNRG